MHPGRGMRTCLGILMLVAAAAAQLELALELANFGKLHGADQPAASSTLLAQVEDTPILLDLASEITAGLLFGHLPAAAVRDVCTSWQGSELSQDPVTYRSALNARAKPGSLRVSYVSNCPNQTETSAAPQLAATTGSGLQLIASCAGGLDVCSLWLVGPDIDRLLLSYGHHLPARLKCGHDGAQEPLSCHVVGPIGEQGCLQMPELARGLCKPSMLEVKAWPTRTDMTFVSLQTELAVDHTKRPKPASEGSASNFAKAQIVGNPWAAHLSFHDVPRKPRI